jgi:hypothetical protein
MQLRVRCAFFGEFPTFHFLLLSRRLELVRGLLLSFLLIRRGAVFLLFGRFLSAGGDLFLSAILRVLDCELLRLLYLFCPFLRSATQGMPVLSRGAAYRGVFCALIRQGIA